MPKHDAITIRPAELQLLLDQLAANSWSQGAITIYDAGNQFNIRDQFGFLITSIKKETNEKPV